MAELLSAEEIASKMIAKRERRMSDENLKELDLKREDITHVIGQWAITKSGIESLDVYYPIALERITKQDWLTHMAEKNWVNMRDFIYIHRYAMKYFGLKTVDFNPDFPRYEQ